MKPRLHILTVLMIALSLAVGSAWAADGRDLTQVYLDGYADNCALGAAHINVLRQHQVLLVPGYLSRSQKKGRTVSLLP
jgi:hypothetical protein